MHRALALPILLCALLLGPVPALAQPQRPGAPAAGADHPLVGRYEGSDQRFRQQREFEELRLATAAITGRQPGQPRLREGNSALVSGRYTRLLYAGPPGRSPLEVVRNLQGQLERNGFSVVFSCRGRDCGGTGADLWFAVTEESPIRLSNLPSNWSDQVYAVLRRERPEGDVWVALLSVPEPRAGSFTVVDVVEARPMERDRVVFVSADEMARAIAQGGRVALYGILFDTDRADPRPDSRPTLEEIARFLRANPALSVIVVGHTDNQGAFDYNVDLSRRRAAAIVAILTREFGIAPARLTPFGAGMAAPVASNETAEGRAQNRRVEIVRR
ncbi:MAG: DUF4892 domain-containing protein [Acetobacteraceae bacterium]|nr:DUF4892 domain-containing protein [Acetobacteraceae bacterium]